MKKLLLSSLILAGLFFTLSANAQDLKIGVVDVNAVVAKSAQVKALKSEQQSKIKELETWLVGVKADVDKQSTKENKEKSIKKYDAEFAKRQNEIRENYAKKLLAIDKSISATISEEAKKQGYDIILSKSSVLYGGSDITSSIVKVVK